MSKQRPGSTYRWRTLRTAILARDGHACRLRCPGEWPVKGGMAHCTQVATHVHHIHGWTRCAGCRADLPSHLMATCAPCNLHVGDPGRTSVLHKPMIKTVTQW